jgi:CubicO group peptidase (beta-lactamase class C family)
VTRLAEFLDEEIAAGSFPGAEALVATSASVIDQALAGEAAIDPRRVPLEPGTLFDLASLTKPLCTGALARRGLLQGLSLADPPGRFLPEWKKSRYDGITVETLLTHTSGLPDWYPLYARGEGPASYRRTLGEIEPETRPGEAVRYSDPGFLVIGEILERLLGATLAQAFAELVAGPSGSGAVYLPEPGRACAATEKGDRFERAMTAARGFSYAGFRDGVAWGEVHDGNALRRGGVAAHAGLFGTAWDVWRLAREWLDPAASRFTRDATPLFPEARGLAWQGCRGAGSSVAEFSPGAFGHTGFTGTSVWIDPDCDGIFVLLTNRIHPEVRDVNFHLVRQRFHRAAVRLL